MVDQLSQEELDGQRLAVELTAKLKMLADERIEEAIKNLAIGDQSEQLSQLCETIAKAITSLAGEKGSAISDYSGLQNSLDETRAATLSTNEALRELIKIAEAPRVVIYDTFGRIKEIRRGK